MCLLFYGHAHIIILAVVVVLCVELSAGAEEAVSRQSQSEAISRDAAGGSGEV